MSSYGSPSTIWNNTPLSKGNNNVHGLSSKCNENLPKSMYINLNNHQKVSETIYLLCYLIKTGYVENEACQCLSFLKTKLQKEKKKFEFRDNIFNNICSKIKHASRCC